MFHPSPSYTRFARFRFTRLGCVASRRVACACACGRACAALRRVLFFDRYEIGDARSANGESVSGSAARSSSRLRSYERNRSNRMYTRRLDYLHLCPGYSRKETQPRAARGHSPLQTGIATEARRCVPGTENERVRVFAPRGREMECAGGEPLAVVSSVEPVGPRSDSNRRRYD